LKTEKYKYFQHRDCEFFPCHKTDDPDNFNCMFCYCPLYMLGDRCGGNFTFTKDGIKNCKDCLFPHLRENYDRLMARYPEIAAVVAANTGEKPEPPDAVPPENSRDTPPEPPDT